MATVCFKCGEPIEIEFITVFGMRVPTSVWLHSNGGSFDQHRPYPDWYTPQMRAEPTERIETKVC